MDGITQLSESVYEWWTSQQRLLNECQTVPIPTGDMEMPMRDMYSGTLRIWEKSVDECLSAQAAMSRQMRDLVNQQEMLPEEVKGAIFQMQDINDKWREGREKLWHDWFSLMKTIARHVEADLDDEDEPSTSKAIEVKAESKASGEADTEAGKSKAKSAAKTATDAAEGNKKKALQA